MKHRISAVLLLSLMLSMLFIPLAVTADDGKSIIKGMVQAPTDYSVGITPYSIPSLDRNWAINYWMDRPLMYLPSWVFNRF